MAGLVFPDGAWVPPDEWFGGAGPDPGVPPPAVPLEAGPAPGTGPLGGGDGAGLPGDAEASQIFPPSDWFQPAAAEAVAGTLPAPAPTMVPAAVAAQGPPGAPGAPPAPDLLLPGQAPGFGVELAPPGFPGALFPQSPPAEGAPGYQLGARAPSDAETEAEGLADQGLEAVARHGADLETRQADYYQAGLAEADRTNRQTQEKAAIRWRAEEADLQKERIAVRADAQKLAQDLATGVKANSWDGFKGGRMVANVISAIAGGLVAPYHGGRNSGLELINDAVNRYVETEKFNLNQRQEMLTSRRSLLGELTAANNDQLRSEETLRLALHELAINELKAKAAGLDPRGSAVQRIALAIQGARAQQEALAVKADERLFNRKKDLFDMRIRQETLQEQRAGRAAGAKAERDRAAFAERQLEAQMRREGFAPDGKGGWTPLAAAGPDLETQVKEANLGLIKERTAKVRAERVQQETKTRAEGSAAGGSPYTFGDQRGQPFRQKDGRLFEVTDDTRRKEIGRLNVSAQNVRRLVDLMKRMRESGGGASKWLGTPEYQTAVSLAQILDFDTLKNFGLGAPTGRDVELVHAARGGKDITSFIYDPGPGLESLANQAQSKLDSEMRGAGYDGPRVEFTSLGPTPAQLTPDQGVDLLRSGPAAGTDAADRRELVKSKKELLSRWAKDSPWLFEGVNADQVKALWADQVAAMPEATDEQKADKAAFQREMDGVAKAFDKAREKATLSKALNFYQYDYQRRSEQAQAAADEEDAEDEE